MRATLILRHSCSNELAWYVQRERKEEMDIAHTHTMLLTIPVEVLLTNEIMTHPLSRP